MAIARTIEAIEAIAAMKSRRSLLSSLLLLGGAGAAAWWARDRLFWPAAAVSADGTDSGWIPFLDGPTRLGVIPVEIMGEIVPALIDSGAQASIVDRGLADRLGLETAPAPPMIAFGAGGNGQAASGVDVSLTAGELRFSRIRAARLDLGPIARLEGGGVEVILGQDVLQAVVADIDFPASRVRFRTPEVHVDPEGAQAAPVAARGRGLEARLSIEGSVIDVLIDTGATAALTLTRQAAGAAGLLDGRPSEPTRNIVLGGVSMGETITAGPLRFAGRSLDEVAVHIMADQSIPGFPRGLLGLGVLRSERVILDLGAGEMRLA